MLNTIGLVLNIAGVVLLFFYGFPQPSHEEGVGLDLGNVTLPDGRTADEYNQQVRRSKTKYLRLSRLALASILAGFLFQLGATLK